MPDPAFHYAIRPNQSNPGTWTARPVPQPEYTQDQLVADTVADLATAGTPLTAEQVTACGTAILRRILSAAAATRKTRDLFGLMDFSPSAGGVLSDPEVPATPDALNVYVNMALTDTGYATFIAGMTFTREAVEGIRAPDITTVLRFEDSLPYRYTPGAGFRILGSGFGKKPTLTGTTPNGVYAVPAGGGTATRITAYSKWTDVEIGGTWPSTLSGYFYVRVVTSYPGTTDPRSDETTTPMSP